MLKIVLLTILAFISVVFVCKEHFIRYRPLSMLALLPLVLFVILSIGFVTDNLGIMDEWVYQVVSGFISHTLTQVMIAFSSVGSPWVLVVLGIIAFLVTRKRNRVYGNLIVANVILCNILNELLKNLYRRQRPDILRLTDVVGFSFPSGHSMLSASFYGMLVYIAYQNTQNKFKRAIFSVLLISLIACIGLSRIYLGVHFASDVAAGFCMGLVWLLFFIALYKKYENQEGMKGH